MVTLKNRVSHGCVNDQMQEQQAEMNLSSINDQSEYVNILDNLIGSGSLDRKNLFYF